MQITEIRRIVENIRKGTFTRIEYVSEPSLTAAAKKAGHVITKHTTKVVRLGVNYGHIAEVKRQEALRTEPKIERAPWYSWEVKDTIAKHNTKEAYYLAFATVNKGHNTKTTWFLDGVEVTAREIRESGLIIPSYFNTDGEMPVVQRINVENIIALGSRR